MHVFLLVAALALPEHVVLTPDTLAPPRIVTTHGVGTGPTSAAACEEARRMAMRQAIEQLGLLRVRAHTALVQQHIMEENATFWSDGFVRALRDQKRETFNVPGSRDRGCRFWAKAEVFRAADRSTQARAAAAFLARNRPTVQLMLRTSGDAGLRRRLRAALEEVLGAAGWRLVGRRRGGAAAKHLVLRAELELERRPAQAGEGLLEGVRVPAVVDGFLSLRLRAPESRAARLLGTASGEATASAFRMRVAESHVLRRLLRPTVQTMLEGVYGDWARAQYSGTSWVVELRGAVSLGAVNALRRHLREHVPGVGVARLEAFDQGSARLSVEAAPDALQAANYLDAGLRRLQWRLVYASPYRLVLEKRQGAH